jgi:hypothetical protein
MTTETADWVGLTLDGRYTVTAKLGEGGMGFVYRARDGRLNCDVVVKVPRAAMLEDAGFRQRFQNEVRALVQLAHPHVVKVSDFGQHGGVPCAVMQFLPGGSLEDRRPKDDRGRFKPVAPRSLAGWLPQVADALDFIHKRGYVHRDIKPANILFDGFKNAYISDFGVAKAVAGNRPTEASVTGAGLVLGTPSYMAPELVLGEKFDGRIDQYALAVTVFELLAGRPPFEGATPMAVLVKRTTEDAPALAGLLPATPAALSTAIARGLSRDPAARFPNCAAFAEAVVAASAIRGHPHSETVRTDGPESEKVSRQTPNPGATQTLVVGSPPVAVRRAKSGTLITLGGGIALFAGVIALTVWLAVRGRSPEPVVVMPPAPTVDEPAPPKRDVREAAKTNAKHRPAVPKAKDRPPIPPPALAGVTSVRPSPAAVKLLAGGPPLTLTVAVEHTGDGPVRLTVQAPAQIQVTPAEQTIKAGDRDPGFELTVADPAAKTVGTLRIIASAENSLSKSILVEVLRHDFDVSLAPHGPLDLQAGQTTSVTVKIDRRGGYRGPLKLSLDGHSSLDAQPVVVAADESEAIFSIKARGGASAGTATANLKASASYPGLQHDVSFPVRIFSLAKVQDFKDERPADAVTALASDAAGRLVLSGHSDGTIRLWDAATGTAKWTSRESHDGPVLSLAFATDGKHAVSGGGKLVMYWTLATGEPKRFQQYHQKEVWHVGLDGLIPVSMSADKVIHWNAMTGEPRRPDQGKIAGTSGVHLWIDPGRPLGPDARVPSGGWQLAGWGTDTLNVFQGNSPVADLPGNGGGIKGMSASAAGRALTLGGDGLLRLWDVRAKKLLPGFPLKTGTEVTAATLDSAGDRILVGGPGGALSVWRLQ